MLVSLNSYDVLANEERLFGVTLVIWSSQAQKPLFIVCDELLLMMIDAVRACGSQIANVTANIRSLSVKTAIINRH